MFDLNCARMPARAALSIRLEVSCQDVAGEKTSAGRESSSTAN